MQQINTTIRPYLPKDRESCIAIFQSNLPRFFDASELSYFLLWLDGLDAQQISYFNARFMNYHVIENNGQPVGCGGIYRRKTEDKIVMAWGMIHSQHHRKGLGKTLFSFRLNEARKLFPNDSIIMDTSQHTVAFYVKQGFVILSETLHGYGEGLHKYELEFAPNF